jgi:hypothetical protein
MPKIDEICTIINTSIQGILNTSRYQGAKYYTTADIVKDIDKEKGEIWYPVIIDNDGEGTSVVVDDTYPLQIYHRILSLNNELIDVENYGDENQKLKETAQMTMVIISDRGILQMKGEDLIEIIAVNLPGKLTQGDLNTLQLNSVNIFASGEVIIDNEIVYKREYNTGEYLLKPNSIMFSLAYTIITVFDKKCFPYCS